MKKIIILITTILLLLTLVTVYFQVWKKPFEVNSGIAKQYLTFKEHSDWFWEVAFSPDGELIASRNKTVSVWLLIN
jgi:WD40 repeat protein